VRFVLPVRDFTERRDMKSNDQPKTLKIGWHMAKNALEGWFK
jgi:hypothetical protein